MTTSLQDPQWVVLFWGEKQRNWVWRCDESLWNTAGKRKDKIILLPQPSDFFIHLFTFLFPHRLHLCPVAHSEVVGLFISLCHHYCDILCSQWILQLHARANVHQYTMGWFTFPHRVQPSFFFPHWLLQVQKSALTEELLWVRCLRLGPFVTLWCRRGDKVAFKSLMESHKQLCMSWDVVKMHITQLLPRKQTADGCLFHDLMCFSFKLLPLIAICICQCEWSCNYSEHFSTFSSLSLNRGPIQRYDVRLHLLGALRLSRPRHQRAVGGRSSDREGRVRGPRVDRRWPRSSTQGESNQPCEKVPGWASAAFVRSRPGSRSGPLSRDEPPPGQQDPPPEVPLLSRPQCTVTRMNTHGQRDETPTHVHIHQSEG